jgi:hypothetical protein
MLCRHSIGQHLPNSRLLTQCIDPNVHRSRSSGSVEQICMRDRAKFVILANSSTISTVRTFRRMETTISVGREVGFMEMTGATTSSPWPNTSSC